MANLATEFRRLGHQPTIVTAQWEPHWPTECVHREISVVRLPQPQIRGWGTIRYMHALARWLRKHQAELDAVLVSRLRHDAYAAVSTLRGSRVPVILRAEGSGVTGDVAWQKTARFGNRIKQACLGADAIIAANSQVVEELHTAGYAKDRTHMVPSGVTLPPPRDADQQFTARLAISDANMSLEMIADARLVVYTGRLHEQKGLPDLVRAWEKIAKRWPNARLWLVGEGPQRDDLYDLMVDLGLHHQVFLPGAFDDITEVLAAADLFVLPSYEVGTSLALLEAMAAGVPVIASDIPGHRRLVQHEITGLLVPPHAPAALSAAIERLIEQRELAADLALNARLLVEAEYLLERMAQRHVEVIEAQR
jgi:glycosyltransferase involved in cell wall biosynthesis